MNNFDTDTSAVLSALNESLDGVTMNMPAEQIMTTGRTRLHRRRLAGAATAVVAAAGVAFGVTTYANPPPAPPGTVHIQTVAYTVAQQSDGTVEVTWDKQRYFEDREGLQAALRKAGFPVLIRVGEFCTGPNDDATLDPSGSGPGVDRVVQAQREADGKVTFRFIPSAVPPGKQLFIGYLNGAQLAVTHGAPGSVERLISTGVPLNCTTVAPPPHLRQNGNETSSKGK
ncbi:hypothetical protein [Paractinoplanes rishiriensis]|uniref:Uncharacterized protein n=1 Tax=Paractinoplanes rishiriensis TaxID=1050105 RepID=A0A919JYI7_9ACTN|nr:hypothetical protein [Actinoplanes rishiriensis]GIE95569.1 hypothetical protein Ari01nite_30340 [Actinoplanes rishiriensis]